MTAPAPPAPPGAAPTTVPLGLPPKRRARSRLGDRAWAWVRVPLILAVAATIVGFTGRWWWATELVGLWRPHLAVLLLPLAGLALWREAWRHATAASAAAVINLCQVMPVYLAPPVADPTPDAVVVVDGKPVAVDRGPVPVRRTLVLLYADLGHRPAAATRAAAQTLALHADIAAFTGVDAATATGLADLLQALPAHLITPADPADPAAGAAIFARGADLQARPDLDGALLRADGLTLLLAHADAGLGHAAAAARRTRFAALADAALAEPDVVVLGDLGCAPWSPPLRDLIGQGRLRDGRCGFGVLPTWPAACPWLGLPLDHCLVAGSVRVRACRIGPDLGGGHRPLIVELDYETPPPGPPPPPAAKDPHGTEPLHPAVR
jgi:hypothetical protein